MYLIQKLFPCRFNDPKCMNRASYKRRGCCCGKGETTVVAPAPPSIQDTARETLQAQLEFNPRAAEQSFDILSNPQFGALPTTQLIEDVRSQVFEGESDVRNQLIDNVLQQLASPTGITPDQQAAIDLRRGQAQDDLTEALRTRANLGGGLFGGRSQRTEERAVRDLQAQFSEEDINRQERERLNAIQAALPLLSVLFPEIGITPPQFQSPVPSANAAFGGTQQAQQQQFNANAFNVAQNSALQQELFRALGTVGAGVAAGRCWVAAEIFGGWYHPKTCAARYFISRMAPKWFRDFYTKHGEKFAEYISNKPFLKALLRPMFELFALIGTQKKLA